MVIVVISVVDIVFVMRIIVGGVIGVIVIENGMFGRLSKIIIGKYINVWMFICGGIRRRI